MNTPMIDRVLNAENSGFEIHMEFTAYDCAALVTELRALLADRDTLRALANANAAERDRWKAKAEAAQPRPVREYKGVMYEAPYFHVRDYYCASAAKLIADHPSEFTDADHAAILALRDEAEKAVTVESVVQAWWRSQNCYEIRTADLCAHLRSAFPHIEQGARVHDCETWCDEGIGCRECNPIAKELDAPRERVGNADEFIVSCKECGDMKAHAHCTGDLRAKLSRDLTAAECVARLRDGGATFWRVATAYADGADKPQRAICAPVLVLTTAQAPEAA